MNLRQIEVFRAVMNTGSTSGAAQFLSISQPAVSRMLTHTEESLGFPLFERRRGKLFPTDEARQLHLDVEPLFLAVEAAEARIDDLRNGRTGRVRVVAIPTIANTILPQAMRILMATTPNVEISVDVRRWEQVAAQVESNTADVGFAMMSDDRPNLRRIPMHAGRLVCILPRDHMLATRPTIYPSDLINQPFVRLTPDSPLGRLTRDCLGDVNHLIRTVVETRYNNTACAFVNAEIGVGLVDEFVLSAGGYPELVSRPFIPEGKVTAYAIVSEHRPVSRLVRRVMRGVQKQLQARGVPS